MVPDGITVAGDGEEIRLISGKPPLDAAGRRPYTEPS